MDIAAGIEAQLAMTQQAIALTMVKKAADMDKAIVSILQQAIDNVPVSSTRGSVVNIAA